MMSNKNQLSDQKSLYLRQHAKNPVKWQIFSKEAINLAQMTNKPIFISIGYSSCHWCHVMSEESFSNEKIATFLNENFINIKIDKDEYPDLDHYYQQAAQVFTGNSGWPLNVFLFSDLMPFFAGSYFPPFSIKNQGNGFFELINELNTLFKENNNLARENGQKVLDQMKDGLMPEGKIEFDGHFPHPMSILSATSDFMDNESGGFGNAPKFPQFSFFEWGVEQMLEGMLEEKESKFIVKTINNILMGGIFDHARGGIHRYSTDKSWKVPHFEKMLYDQAGLLKVLSKFCLVESTPLVFDAIYNTLDYLEKEMMSEKDKYFFSSQDAESEKIDGLYFTFSNTEFEDVLSHLDKKNPELKIEEQFTKILEWFQISKGGSHNGLNVISLAPQFIEDYKKEVHWVLIRKIREELLNQRKHRIPPTTDPKGIASWNFLLLNSLIDVIQFCPIIPLRQKATQLFNILVEGCFKNFMSTIKSAETNLDSDNDQTKQQIKSVQNNSLITHSTTLTNEIIYFEDYVFFAESQLRLSEITANDIFVKNFKDSISFIHQNFINAENKIYLSVNLNDHNSENKIIDYPKTYAECFDYSFRSPLATYMQLLRRYQILFKSSEYQQLYLNLKDEVIDDILKNPMNSGEALRALTYPDESFRTLEIPMSWIEKEDFLNMLPYFLHRFTIKYHNNEKETFQICSMNSCEIEGVGIEQFKERLTSSQS